MDVTVLGMGHMGRVLAARLLEGGHRVVCSAGTDMAVTAEGAYMDVTVLGVGHMGRALAARLVEGGHRVVVWNRSKGKAAELVSAGAREAPSVADAVRGVDVVITTLSDDAAVRAVAFGDLRSSIGDNTIYANCSTVSPELNGELAEAFPGRFVAVPIMGTPATVRAGKATYLAGGPGGVVDRIGPVLSSLSTTVRRYDSAAMATTAKLANNLLLLSEIIALAESFAVGRSGGLSDDQLRELLGNSPMVAPGIKNRFEGVLTGSSDGWWTIALGAKDAGLAIDVARRANVRLPEADATKQLYEKAAASGLDHADIAAVAELYRGQATAASR